LTPVYTPLQGEEVFGFVVRAGLQVLQVGAAEELRPLMHVLNIDVLPVGLPPAFFHGLGLIPLGHHIHPSAVDFIGPRLNFGQVALPQILEGGRQALMTPEV